MPHSRDCNHTASEAQILKFEEDGAACIEIYVTSFKEKTTTRGNNLKHN